MNADELATQVVQVAAVRAGDTLVLSLPESVTRKRFDEILGLIRAQLPPDEVRVLGVGGGIQMHVLRPGEVAE